MDKYTVKLNARAYRDLDEIFDYISEDLQSPENARKQTDRIWAALKKLDTFPQAHQERLTGYYARKVYRQLPIDNYIAIFSVDEIKKVINIVTIQYQGRNL